jgi:hypothetical protein
VICYLLAQAREQLFAPSATPSAEVIPIAAVTTPAPDRPSRLCCPACGIGMLHIVETLPPCGRSP